MTNETRAILTNALKHAGMDVIELTQYPHWFAVTGTMSVTTEKAITKRFKAQGLVYQGMITGIYKTSYQFTVRSDFEGLTDEMKQALPY